VIVIDVVAIGSGVPYLRYLQSLDPQAVVAELDLVASESVYGLVGLAQFVSLLVAACFFIRWFQVAYANVERLSGRATAHHPGWVIWGFFVPVMNLFRPQQLMREIWDATYLRCVDEPSRVGPTLPADRVNLWWGFFLFGTVIGNVGGRLSWRAVTAADEIPVTVVLLAADCVEVVAGVAAVALVRSVTQMQQPFVSDGGPALSDRPLMPA
jgi:hypothetical protein